MKWRNWMIILATGLVVSLGASSLSIAADRESMMEMIRDIEIESASVILVYFTLQFLPLQARDELLKRIARGMVPGGVRHRDRNGRYFRARGQARSDGPDAQHVHARELPLRVDRNPR